MIRTIAGNYDTSNTTPAIKLLDKWGAASALRGGKRGRWGRWWTGTTQEDSSLNGQYNFWIRRKEKKSFIQIVFLITYLNQFDRLKNGGKKEKIDNDALVQTF